MPQTTYIPLFNHRGQVTFHFEKKPDLCWGKSDFWPFRSIVGTKRPHFHEESSQSTPPRGGVGQGRKTGMTTSDEIHCFTSVQKQAILNIVFVWPKPQSSGFRSVFHRGGGSANLTHKTSVALGGNKNQARCKCSVPNVLRSAGI